MLFREIDDLVHKFERFGFTNLQDMIRTFYTSIFNLIKSLDALLRDHILLLVTDHGYDVMLKDYRVYPYHKWTGRQSLSVIAPILVLW